MSGEQCHIFRKVWIFVATAYDNCNPALACTLLWMRKIGARLFLTSLISCLVIELVLVLDDYSISRLSQLAVWRHLIEITKFSGFFAFYYRSLLHYSEFSWTTSVSIASIRWYANEVYLDIVKAFRKPEEPFLLFRLPPELRNRVYEHALAGHTSQYWLSQPDWERVVPDLLLVDDRLAQEAMGYYWSEGHFEFYIDHDKIADLKAFFKGITIRALKHLRSNKHVRIAIVFDRRYEEYNDILKHGILHNFAARCHFNDPVLDRWLFVAGNCTEALLDARGYVPSRAFERIQQKVGRKAVSLCWQVEAKLFDAAQQVFDVVECRLGGEKHSRSMKEFTTIKTRTSFMKD